MSLPRILLLFSLGLAGVVALLLWSGKPPEPSATKWPWQIETLSQGRSSVFGLTLPESSLEQATETFRNLPELAVFRSTDGNYSLEAYYNRVDLGGLQAKVVLRLDPTPLDPRQLFEQGGKPKPQKSGEYRVALGDKQKAALATAPIVALTYLPAAQLDATTVAARFGEPGETLPVSENRAHWLYPDRGLIITLDEDEKEVLQYVAPRDFGTLLNVVEQRAERATGD